LKAVPSGPVRVASDPLATVEPGDLDAARAFAACRADGHSWQHSRSALRDGDMIVRASSCSECGTVRKSYYPYSGGAPRRVYAYPESYAFRGEHALSRTQWRRVMIEELEA
jgi:hypothetical protein